MTGEADYTKDVKNVLTEIQTFDTRKLPQANRLSTSFQFTDAVEPANRLIKLFSKISLSTLDDLPESDCNAIKSSADEVLKRFKEVLKFDETQPNAFSTKEQYVTNLKQMYNNIFKKIFNYISYSASVSVDFQKIEAEAQKTISEIDELRLNFEKEMNETKKKTDQILTEVREAAAEQGVTQMAKYFKQESESHKKSSTGWLWGTLISAILMVAYAVSSIWLHKWILPSNTHENVQLGVSKVLVFAVLSYSLYLCAKNFLVHKHNQIVNRHRQNALMTYRTIADAAADDSNKDVVIVQAAMCIYSPQPTGYTKQAGDNTPSTKSVIELLTKPFSAAGD